jgi:RHS repeat-associated protein
LSYYLYRFYDANLQRWPNKDPGVNPGFESLSARSSYEVEFSRNLFKFVSNDPISRLDPVGLTDGDVETEKCKERCFKWAEKVQKAGGNGKKAYEDCDNGCDRDPKYIPGSPIPPLPLMPPKVPTGFWGACKEICKTASQIHCGGRENQLEETNASSFKSVTCEQTMDRWLVTSCPIQ